MTTLGWCTVALSVPVWCLLIWASKKAGWWKSARHLMLPSGGHDNGIAEHTVCYGSGAIYKLSFLDETTARMLASQLRHRPVEPYTIESALRGLDDASRRALTGHRAETEDDDIPY